MGGWIAMQPIVAAALLLSGGVNAASHDLHAVLGMSIGAIVACFCSATSAARVSPSQFTAGVEMADMACSALWIVAGVAGCIVAIGGSYQAVASFDPSMANLSTLPIDPARWLGLSRPS